MILTASKPLRNVKSSCKECPEELLMFCFSRLMLYFVFPVLRCHDPPNETNREITMQRKLACSKIKLLREI
uniref:Uncharacterized protein n=1 Tax=Arundo donax TaxID=35708 RepID=A0A0A9CS52_ARUDO